MPPAPSAGRDLKTDGKSLGMGGQAPQRPGVNSSLCEEWEEEGDDGVNNEDYDEETSICSIEMNINGTAFQVSVKMEERISAEAPRREKVVSWELMAGPGGRGVLLQRFQQGGGRSGTTFRGDVQVVNKIENDGLKL